MARADRPGSRAAPPAAARERIHLAGITAIEKDIPMKQKIMHGAALALLAATMAGAGDAAALPGGPPIACTEALYGQFYTVERYRPATGWVYNTYVCDAPGGWQLYMVCDAYGCILY